MDCRDKTAYCGLYCSDCIPGDQRIYDAVEKTLAIFDEVGMERYAAFSAQKSKVFEQYPQAIAVLGEILKLKCSGSCRRGPDSVLGCMPDCPIRVCVLGKTYDGCWECPDHRTCVKLERLKGFHPSINETLEAIAVGGVEGWVSHRLPHYPWSKERER